MNGRITGSGFFLKVLIISILVMSLSSCSKKKSRNDTAAAGSTTASAEIACTSIKMTPTPTPAHLHEKQSILTGEWIDSSVIEKRPFAVMFNNIEFANPQSGISEADILYEALAEGGITRLMGIIGSISEDSPAADRLGSVRSARHYYVSIADEYDAIFVHFGETTYATKKMKELGIDHITGMYGAGVSAFYRDKTIKAPHNAFATLEGLNNAVAKAGYRTDYMDNYSTHFLFYEEDTPLCGDIPICSTIQKQLTVTDISSENSCNAGNVKSADRITLGFSDYQTPYFTYDLKTKTYLRFQFGGPHIDYNTGKQLSFKNIIIEYVEEKNKDKNGYQTIDFEDASGSGFYITDGQYVPITWTKNEKKRYMRYFDETGNELTVNPGKTYIAVYPLSRQKHLIIE